MRSLVSTATSALFVTLGASLDRPAFDTAAALFDQLTWHQREHRILPPQGVDAGRVLDTGKFRAKHARPQHANLVLVEVAHIVAYQFRRRVRRRTHAVPLQFAHHMVVVLEHYLPALLALPALLCVQCAADGVEGCADLQHVSRF